MTLPKNDIITKLILITGLIVCAIIIRITLEKVITLVYRIHNAKKTSKTLNLLQFNDPSAK